MAFRENLRKKIEIKVLTNRILGSINPADSTQRIDSEAMKALLELGEYSHQRERDLDLFRIGDQTILVLDNELKIYSCSAEEIGLRKSPTVKEMLSIRNAIKILNDKDVVISRKTDSVNRIKKEMIEGLDLTYNEADIAAMVEDGRNALKNNYTDGILEILALFVELLAFRRAPKAYRVTHFQIWGKVTGDKGMAESFGPAIIFGRMHNDLKMFNRQVSSRKKEDVNGFQELVKGERDAEVSGAQVLEALKTAVLAQPQSAKK